MKQNIAFTNQHVYWLVILLLFILVGCRDKREKEYQPSIKNYPSLANPESSLARIKRPNEGENSIWLPPRKLVTDKVALSEKITTPTLVKVEIQTYPKIDCDNDTRQIEIAKNRGYLAPITQQELADYGKVAATEHVWIMLGVTQDVDEAKFSASWLGVALQLAGKGERVFFDASQNCAADIEYETIIIPTQTFMMEKSIQNKIFISQMQPFTAKIVEVCANPVVTVKIIETRGYNLYHGKRLGTSKVKATLTAQCPSGSKIFINDWTNS